LRARRSLPDIVITTTTITTLLNTRTHKTDSARGKQSRRGRTVRLDSIYVSQTGSGLRDLAGFVS